MSEETQWRDRAKAALEAHFHKHSFPRTALGIILVFTGLFGFLVSFALLHAGLVTMWIRYPLAVFAAYGVFLGLLRGWVELERSEFDPRQMEDLLRNPSQASRGGMSSAHSSWLDWLDLPDVGWLDGDGCMVVIVVGALLGLCFVVILSLMDAPGLLAEVYLDAFLVSILYRRLRIAEKEHWLGTAIRRTFPMVLVTAILVSIGGACLERLAPGAHSIGPAIEKLWEPRPGAQ